MDELDEITLTGLRVFGRHGVFDFEREQGQNFIVDVRMRLSVAAAAESDDVADTVHYGEVADRIVEIVSGEPVDLLETLATRIADDLLIDARLQRVSVTVHKPQAPIDADFTDVAVTVHRSSISERGAR